MTPADRPGVPGRSTGAFAFVAILLCALSFASVAAQDTNRVDLPVDTVDVDSLTVDTTLVPADIPAVPRPDVLPRLTAVRADGIDYLSLMVLEPHASFTELLRDRGLFGVHRTSAPTFPSTFSYGSNGPGSVPILYDGTLLETGNGAALEPLFVPLFRVGDIEVLRGLDAALYAGASARAGLHVLPQAFDVEGSYIRFGYTGSPGDVARVGVLFARNIGSDMGISFNFRRTPATDINVSSDNGSILGGDVALDWFPDQSTRVTARAQVQELDRQENGGLGRTANSPVIDGITEERRRRRLSVSWIKEGAVAARDTAVSDSPTDSIDAGLLSPYDRGAPGARYMTHPDHTLTTASLFYQHDGRTLLSAGNVRERSIDDLFGLSGTLIRPFSPTSYVRAHLHGSLADGESGRLHAASLVGFLPSTIGFEAGAGITGGNDWIAVLLAGIRGHAGEIGWAIDGRYYPGDPGFQDDPVGYLRVDTASDEAYASRWIVEARSRYSSGDTYLEVEGGFRGLLAINSDESATAFDAGATVRFPVGPLILSGGGRSASVSAAEKLFPAFRGEVELGYAFDLLRGALDIYTALRGEAASPKSGFRYDPLTNDWYSLPEDRATPITQNPYLSGVITARIGTAFFSFELTNLLNTSWWTVRRRPYSGFGLRFGLTWGLVD